MPAQNDFARRMALQVTDGDMKNKAQISATSLII